MIRISQDLFIRALMVSLLLLSISILSIFSPAFIVVQQANAQPIITFGKAIDLSNNTGDSRSPKIVASGSNVYAVWFDNTPGNFEIFFARSTDGGATFGTPINLSTDPGISSFPQIGVSGRNVYVVWTDDTPGNFEIFFARSTDGGNTFSSPINLSTNNAFSSGPKIVANGTNVYIAWQEGAAVFFTRSTDNGATFDPPLDLSNIGRMQIAPDIAVFENNVYVVAMGTSGSNIFFIRSTDGGATFGTPINLSNNPGTGGLDFPRVAAYGKNVYVVWRDNTAIASGNNEVFFSRSTDNGATFASPINLSKTSAGSDPAEIAAISDNVYVLWREGISSSTIPDILFAGSTNNGTSFNTINISKTSGDSSMPSMAISGTRNVSVVWEDNTNSIAGSYYPYFSRSTDSGSTFSKPIVVANITGEAREPRVAMSDDKVHIVWSEDEQEIYYTTNTISDNPPNCITALPTRSVLWPPNHLMNNVMITGITDPDGDPIKVKITSIHQDEPTKTNPGDPSPDGAGIGTNTAQIRAERTMPGDGRVYHIAFTADDGRGKTCDGEVTVSVPPDQAHSAIDSAPPSYDSTR